MTVGYHKPAKNPRCNYSFMKPNSLRVFRVSKEKTYTIHPDHRNCCPSKSQWTISEVTEKNIFLDALGRQWIQGVHGWGLLLTHGNLSYVGVSSDRKRKLFVARFIDGASSHNWHGYPADHQRCQRDIPSTSVLNDWLQSGILPAPKIRKLMRGQPCNL